jgi:hypothetical protein
MAIFLKPHTPEWFTALEAFNPQQAAHTRQIVRLAKSNDVCSVCGDDPAKDYKLDMPGLPANAVARIRLCDDCFGLRKKSGENFVLI